MMKKPKYVEFTILKPQYWIVSNDGPEKISAESAVNFLGFCNIFSNKADCERYINSFKD